MAPPSGRDRRRVAMLAAGCALTAVAALAGCNGDGDGSAAPASSTGSPDPASTASRPAVDPGGPRTGGRPVDAGGWPTYHHDLARTGAAPGGPAGRQLRTAWHTRLDGAVYASPLVLPQPGGDVVIAATEGDSVYALDRADGSTRWRRDLGTPVPLSDLPCGNIDPLGITGTPAYDRATGAVYAVAELADPIRHELVALDARTGQVRWRRVVDPAGSHPVAQQQRAALAVANGRVYVAFGGLAGDCGDYHGYVVGSRLDGTGPLDVYRTPSEREAGIWAPPGPAVSGRGLYVTVGNGSATSPPYDGSDSVLRLSPDLRRLDLFAPRGWAAENAADLDLSSTGAVLLPGARLVASGKEGTTYLLDANRLGGIGGALATLRGCHAYGGTAALGRTVVLPCEEGVQAVSTDGDRLRRLWRADGVTGTPVIGSAGVWALDTDAGDLWLLDRTTGRRLASTGVGAVTRFAAPALAGGMILVPTEDGVRAVVGRG